MRIAMLKITVGLILTITSIDHSFAQILSTEDIEDYSKSIVQLVATVNEVEKFGTGFFVDSAGHILTAAHNVMPTANPLAIEPLQSRTVTAKIYDPESAGSPVQLVEVVVLYVDSQTDLALLRANLGADSRKLELAVAGTLRSGAQAAIMSWEADIAAGHAIPAYRPARIDSVFNASKNHDGLIDITGDDIHASSSGSPLLDEYGLVAGVFTKGKRSTGEAAVPISFSSTLMHMAGIPYPSNEVKEVISELRKDLVNWVLIYDETTTDARLFFRKRLKAGESPVQFTAVFDVFAGRDDHLITITKSLQFGRLEQKDGVAIFQNVGQEADQQIKRFNESPDNRRNKLGKKQYADVTVEATLEGGSKVSGLIDYRMDFK